MNDETIRDLVAQAKNGGQAYIQNLAAAEAAVLAGQFNLAKVFRATAHARRALALNAARLLADQRDGEKLLEANLLEI